MGALAEATRAINAMTNETPETLKQLFQSLQNRAPPTTTYREILGTTRAKSQQKD
jgi:hypothetical protein